MTFSIRDLVWLTVVVALGVGWWIERTRAERLAEEAEVMDAAEAIIVRHVDKVEKENAQLWSKKCPTLQHPPQTRLSCDS